MPLEFYQWLLNFFVSSERLIDEQINTALEVKEHLHSQRAAMKLIQTKMNDMANRFPMLNSLIQRINFRKRRDSIIIGAVIGICVFLLLLYSFHWADQRDRGWKSGDGDFSVLSEVACETAENVNLSQRMIAQVCDSLGVSTPSYISCDNAFVFSVGF